MTSTEGFTLQFAIRLPDGKLATNPVNGEPYIWVDPVAAERALQGLAHNAICLGVPGWSGEVVRRYCSPFVGASDPCEQLVDELSTWLKKQTGEQQ